jgi:hypothetical protein
VVIMLGSRRAVFFGCLLVLLVSAHAACESDPSSHGATTTGAGGEGGGCPAPAEPMLTLTISAVDGPLPPDTTLRVTWSAGHEPAFALDDPSTWQSLDEGANVVCDVDAKKAPPSELRCELWTSGPTEVVIDAKGYAPVDETFSPKNTDACGPVPTEVTVVLQHGGEGGGPG